MASLEENKALVRRAYEDGMNNRDFAIVDEVFAADYVGHFPGQPPSEGVELLKATLRSFFEAFPDLVFTVDDQVAEGDKVVTRWSAVGTHGGPWHGFPPREHGIAPSGRKVHFAATDIYVIGDGKILEEWNTLEQLAVLEQIGAVPSAE